MNGADWPRQPPVWTELPVAGRYYHGPVIEFFLIPTVIAGDALENDYCVI